MIIICFARRGLIFVGLFVAIVGTCQAQKVSTLCHFTRGPREGETQDYAPMDPLPIGTPCHDGEESYGKVVASDDDE